MGMENINQQGSAPFNMAIATLMRIDGVLKQITEVSSNPIMPLGIKQGMKVNLVKQLFIQSSPLLPSEVVLRLKMQVDKIKPNNVLIGYGSGGVVKREENKTIYNEDLEYQLDFLTVEIQRELQKEKYFMPPRKDLSRAVTEM